MFRRQYLLFLERTNRNHQVAVARLVSKPTVERGNAGEVIYRYPLSAFVQQPQIAYKDFLLFTFLYLMKLKAGDGKRSDVLRPALIYMHSPRHGL